MVAFDHACSCDQEYGKVYVIGQQHLAINDLQIRYQNRVASSKQHTFLRHCWCLKGLKVRVSFIVPRRFFSCLGLTIMILTLMCQPEAHWFFVTKDSFVWLVTNLINKPNVSKQWFLLCVVVVYLFCCCFCFRNGWQKVVMPLNWTVLFRLIPANLRISVVEQEQEDIKCDVVHVSGSRNMPKKSSKEC